MSKDDVSDIPNMMEDAILRVAKHIKNGELLAADPIAFLNAVAERLEKPPFDADFLARQIVDDLYRTGIDARFQQHIIEQTIQAWCAGSGRSWGR